jgi:two-component system, NarL family, invasion response regulator UvrY
MTDTPGIKVMLVDDHAVVRAGYRFLLSYNKDIEVVAEAADGQEALQLLETLKPDVVVVDLTMPGMHGLEVLRQIKAHGHTCKVLVFTMHENPAYVEKAMQSGAGGYLSKNSAPETLVAAIRSIASGKPYIDASIAQNMVVQQTREKGSLFEGLTNREFQILCLFAEGLGVDDIAAKLGLSAKTIANYLTLIKDKLQVGSTQELVRLAISKGLVDI